MQYACCIYLLSWKFTHCNTVGILHPEIVYKGVHVTTYQCVGGRNVFGSYWAVDNTPIEELYVFELSTHSQYISKANVTGSGMNVTCCLYYNFEPWNDCGSTMTGNRLGKHLWHGHEFCVAYVAMMIDPCA